jgi:hypothetical protein
MQRRNMQMSVRETMKKRGARLSLALLFVVGTVVSVSVGAEQSAFASCAPAGSGYTYTITAGCYSVEVYSKCLTFGSYEDSGGVTYAVECADIYATVQSDDTVDVWGEGEFSCQGEHPQCAGMNVIDSFTATLTDTQIPPPNTNTTTENSGGWQCNPTVGACPDGGHKELGTPHVTYSGVGKISTDYTIEPAGEAILVAGAPATFKSPYFATPQITIQITQPSSPPE